MVNKGTNKILYEKRLSKGLTRKEAAKLLHITSPELRFIEGGYIPVRRKLEQSFIDFYELENDFFSNDLGYPVIIKEEETKIVNDKIHKIINHIAFKISCVVLSLGFIAMAVSGAVGDYKTRLTAESFFDQTVLDFNNYVKSNYDVYYDDSTNLPVNFGGPCYELNNGYLVDRNSDVSIYIPANGINIIDTNYETSFKSYLALPTLETKEYSVESFITFSLNKMKIDIKVHDGQRNVAEAIGNVKGDIARSNFNYKHLYLLNDENRVAALQKNDPLRDELANVLNATVDQTFNSFEEFFASDHAYHGNISFISYSNNFLNGKNSFLTQKIMYIVFLIVGIVFSCLFLALSVLFIFKRKPSNENTVEEKEKGIFDEKLLPKKEVPLKKNLRIFPIFPGNLLKVISISMIFVFSIGLFVLFLNAINLNLDRFSQMVSTGRWFSPMLVIAFLLLFFVKLDIIQERKNYFMSNYFYFFSGLALYLLYLFLGISANIQSGTGAKLSSTLLNVLPGNFLWGFLAFNMFVFLLFYNPISFKNDEKKLHKYRLLAIIPISYLVLSLFIEIGMKCWSWQIPFWISNFFFTKSVDLLIFALAFVFFAYLYKRYTVKKYGKENAALYQKGNRYYFIRNIACALIVLIIGIVEIVFHFTYKDNPLGLGEDYLLLLTIPFILLYHPHHGKRNHLIDNLVLTFYDTAYAIGIVLIAVSILIYLVNI